MSDALHTVMAYAADFEKTYDDDDWSRLEQYFADDATYEVIGGPMACHIAGREAIFAGIRKSLDGFDRRSDSRELELLSGPEVSTRAEGEQIDLGWRVIYQFQDAPTMYLPGSSRVTVAGGVIVALVDEYKDDEMGQVYSWMESHGAGLNPSYV